MSTASLTATPTTLDSGTSSSISIKNTGTTTVTVVNGTQTVFLRRRMEYNEAIAGAVTAAVPTELGGSGTITYTVGGSRGDVVTFDELTALVSARTLTPDLTPSTAATGTLLVGQLARLNCGSATLARTLPAASAAGIGGVVVVRRTDTSTTYTAQVSPAGSDTINASASARSVAMPEVAASFVSDGVSNWSVFATDTPASQLTATYVQHVGASSGVDDSSLINAALTAARVAGGGLVRGMPGQTYYVGSMWVIGSNTTLDMTGCTIKLKTGQNHNLLRNYSYAAATTVMDGAMSASGTTLTCATSTPFAGLAVGTPVMVWGADRMGTPLRTTVASVTDSGNVVLANAAVVAVTGATVCIGTRDTDITIIGGDWRRNGGSSFDATNGDMLRFRRADRVSFLRNSFIETTGGFHDINPGDCTGVLIESPTCYHTSQTDLCHLNGPLQGVIVRNVRGTNASMAVSLTPNDYAGTGSNDVYGWITDVLIDGVTLDPGSQGGAVGVISGSSSPAVGAMHVRARNISGYSNGSQGLVIVGDDNGDPTTHGGILDDIVIDGIAPRANSAFALGYVTVGGTNVRTVHIRNISVSPNNLYSPNSPALVVVSATQKVENLLIDGVTVSKVVSGAGPSIINVAGTVTNLSISKVRGEQYSYGVLLTASASRVDNLRISDVHTTDRWSSVQTQAAANTLTLVQLSDIVSAGGAHGLGDIWTTTEVHASNIKMPSGTVDLINLGNAAARVTLYAVNCNFAGKAVTGTAGALLRCKTTGVQVDVGSAFIDKNEGDMAYNTNASSAPFVVGPAVCDGTRWRSIRTGAVKTGTATLVAGTVTVSDTSITANSVIRLGGKTIGGTPGALYVSARSAGASFDITSTNGADTSVVQYWIDAY